MSDTTDFIIDGPPVRKRGPTPYRKCSTVGCENHISRAQVDSRCADCLLDKPPAGCAGFIWCCMCGYNAKLTEVQMHRLAAKGHETWCQQCSDSGNDTLLEIGEEFPDEIAADEPMKFHK